MSRQDWLAQALKKAPKLDAARKAAIVSALPPVTKRAPNPLNFFVVALLFVAVLVVR